jgi:Tfp pilus assembly protein PilF
LANSLLKLATYDEAQAAINHAIKLDDGPVSSYNGVAGIIATFRQDYELAKRQLSAATESPYSRGVEWQESAYYYLCTGDANNAQKAIERAKAIETFPARASRLAGEYYRTAGQLEKAAQEFSVSTSLEAYPPGYRERAVTYMSMKQWRAAYDDLQKSIKLNPLSPVTLSTIAVVENHLGLNELAQAHLKKAFKEKAVPPIVLVNRAAVELANHDNQPAMLDVNEAISIDPWLKEAYLTRAEIYRASGQSAKAVADDDKAKTLISHLDL